MVITWLLYWITYPYCYCSKCPALFSYCFLYIFSTYFSNASQMSRWPSDKCTTPSKRKMHVDDNQDHLIFRGLVELRSQCRTDLQKRTGCKRLSLELGCSSQNFLIDFLLHFYNKSALATLAGMPIQYWWVFGGTTQSAGEHLIMHFKKKALRRESTLSLDQTDGYQ